MSLNAQRDGAIAMEQRWHPTLKGRTRSSLAVHFALNLGGEAGEVVDIIKKLDRDWTDLAMHLEAQEELPGEMADVLMAIFALAAAAGVDLDQALIDKRAFNDERWST